MIREIIINNLPNVLINRVVITENNNMTVIDANVSLVDFAAVQRRRWSSKKILKKIMLNMSLVEGTRNINRIKNREVVLQKKDCISVSASNFISSNTEDNKIRYDYSIKMKIKRKVSNDSSLFFFASRNSPRNKPTNNRKQNHGIYEISKKTKGSLNKAKSGGVKHFPIFVGGNKLDKIHFYKEAGDGTPWNADIKFSVGMNSFFSNVPGIKDIRLEREVRDNNITIYNMPIKKMKNDNKKIFPMLKPKIKKRGYIKKINSLHNRTYLYELDEQIDSNSTLHKFFMINLCNMALSKSKTAQKIYRVDKDLFMQLGQFLSIGRIKIERNKYKNLSRVKKNKKSKYKKNRRSTFIKSKNKTNVIINKNLRKPIRGMGLLNIDDKQFKRPIMRSTASLEIVNSGLPSEIKTIYFTDKIHKQVKNGKISYNVSVDFDDVYYKHVREVLKDISKFKKELINIVNGINKTKSFEKSSKRIKGSFLEKYFNKYQLSQSNLSNSEGTFSDSPIVRGLAAVDSASILLGIKPLDLQIDSMVNLSKVSPSILRAAIKHLKDTVYLLEKRYDIKHHYAKSSIRGRGLKSRKSNKRQIVEKTFRIKTEREGQKNLVKYNFIDFGNKLRIDKTTFDSRMTSELNKYFNGSPTNQDMLGYTFNAETKTKLINIQQNRHQFITPSTIEIGKNIMNTIRFDRKINTKFFNILKATRKKMLSNKKIKNIDFNTRSNIPLLIAAESSQTDESKRENTLSAEKFLGITSPFRNAKLLANKRLVRKKSKSIEKISRKMVFDKKNIKTISYYDLENSNSFIYDQIVDQGLDPLSIPLQIKSLIFNKSNSVKTNFLSNKDDIFRNNSTDEIAFQMYGNIFEVKYVDGFEMAKDGLYDMKNPIIKSMTGDNYNSINGSNKICILQKFTNPMVMAKKDPFISFGTAFLMVDRGESPRTTKGHTSENFNHKHEYHIDKNGNGYTSVAIHPKNPNIRHRHRIINYIVQSAKSSCYPRCEDLYKVAGSAPHAHDLARKIIKSKTRPREIIARRFIENYQNAASVAESGTTNTNTQQTTSAEPVSNNNRMPRGTTNVY